MGTTSTTKPSVDAFQAHLKVCQKCRSCLDSWWALPQVKYEEARKQLDLCEDGRRILRAIFN